MRAARELCRAALLVGALAAAVPQAALAGGIPLEGLGGWEADGLGQGYAFAGVGALATAGARVVIPARLQGSYLYYDFLEGAITTTVRSPGVTAMTGLRLTGSRGSLTILGGAEVRWERRNADTLAAPSLRRTSWGQVLQGEGDVALTRRWHILALANYAGAARYLFARASIRHQFTNKDWKGPRTLFAGMEGTRQGNDESDAWGAGGFFECALVPSRISLSARAGYKEVWSPDTLHRKSAYFGAGVYRRF